jgi:hypothetical protein
MSVKKYPGIVILVFAFIFCPRLHAQELSLQISPGLMNYGGDLQDNTFTFEQANFGIGADLMYRVNHVVIRGGFVYGKIRADDKLSTTYRFRNLSFQSNITELKLCLEYDLFTLDDRHKYTPYVFAGVGFFHFNPYTYNAGIKTYLQPLGTEGQGISTYPDRKVYSLTQFNDPFGIGFKYKISSRILVGIEFCSRLLYTDYLDDVSKKYVDQADLLKAHGQLAVDLSFRGDELDPTLLYPSGRIRGNPKQNDNYYTSAISFTYVFPEHSSFGSRYGGSGKRIKGLPCPKKVR